MTASTFNRSNWLAATSLLTLAAIWGATFFMVKDATSAFPVLAFLTVRFAIASAALLPITLFSLRQTHRWPTRAEWRWGIFAGTLFCGGYIFQTFSLRLIDSGRAGFVTGLYVVLVPILAFIFLRYPISRRVLIGMILAFAGMVCLGYAPGGTLLGDGLAFACAISFASHILAVEKMPRAANWRFMALLQSTTVMILSAVLMLILSGLRGCDSGVCQALATFADPLPTSIPTLVWAVATFTGLLATAAGLAVQVWAQRHLSPSNAALIFALESPFSLVFGVLFRSEVLTLIGFIGCALIFAGTLTTNLTETQSPQHPPIHEPEFVPEAALEVAAD